MTSPYAYTVARDGYHSHYPALFPTLDKAVAGLRKYDCPAYRAADRQDYIKAYYEDGNTDNPSLLSYLEEVVVDLPAVVVYIDDLYAKSEVAYAKYKADFPNGTGFSGGPHFICRLDKKDLVAREVNARKWRWKGVAA
jgi:hypothetical protein